MALEVVKQHDTVIETTMSPRRESAVSLEPHHQPTVPGC